MITQLKDAISSAIVLTAIDKGGRAPKTEAAPKTEESLLPKKTESAMQVAVGKMPDVQETQTFNGEKQDKKPLDEETVSQLTEELNKLMGEINCDLEFKYSKEVNLMSIKMIDRETQEVIKEYPPEEMIEGMIKAREWLGAFLDKNA